MEKRTKTDLLMYQNLPLDIKISMSKMRIEEWVFRYYSDAVVSFSGGKDSTVLLDIARQVKPEIKAMFCDTGLEFPEIREFVKSVPNVIWVKPKLTFREVLRKYGYPMFGKEIAHTIYYARNPKAKSGNVKRQMMMGSGKFASSVYNHSRYLDACQLLPFRIGDQCCQIMKKNPSHQFKNLTTIIGTLAEESRLREQQWMRLGCNAYDCEYPHSMPLSFWTEQDILRYIKEKNLPICSLYGNIVYEDDNGTLLHEELIPNSCKLCTTGFKRTGCMFCGFGVQLEKPKDFADGLTRFERLAVTHPQVYDYIMRGGEWIDNPDYDATLPEKDEMGWKFWNPKKIWIPSANGLGYKFVIDCINDIYGKDFIRY